MLYQKDEGGSVFLVTRDHSKRNKSTDEALLATMRQSTGGIIKNRSFSDEERRETVKMRALTHFSIFMFLLPFTQTKCHSVRLSVPCAPDAMQSDPVVLRIRLMWLGFLTVCFFFLHSFVLSLSLRSRLKVLAQC